jgi:hypothetical protein
MADTSNVRWASRRRLAYLLGPVMLVATIAIGGSAQAAVGTVQAARGTAPAARGSVRPTVGVPPKPVPARPHCVSRTGMTSVLSGPVPVGGSVFRKPTPQDRCGGLNLSWVGATGYYRGYVRVRRSPTQWTWKPCKLGWVPAHKGRQRRLVHLCRGVAPGAWTQVVAKGASLVPVTVVL